MRAKKVITLALLFGALAIVPFAGFVMRHLIEVTDGTLDQHPYTSLEVVNSRQAPHGFDVANGLAVIISNRLGHGHTYRWTAMQSSRVITHGHLFVKSGKSKRITISLDGAREGRLTVALDDGSIFIRVPVHITKPAGISNISNP